MQRAQRLSVCYVTGEKTKSSQYDNEIQHKGRLWLFSFSSTGDLVIVRGRARVRRYLSENFID